MEKPSEDVMIGRILRFYAGQNMDDRRKFSDVIDVFEFREHFNREGEIEVLRKRMMELALLSSKDGRLFITPFGYDIQMKFGGWEKYKEQKEGQERKKIRVGLFKTYAPILISVVALGISAWQAISENYELEELRKSRDSIQNRLNVIEQKITTQIQSTKLDSTKVK